VWVAGWRDGSLNTSVFDSIKQCQAHLSINRSEIVVRGLVVHKLQRQRSEKVPNGEPKVVQHQEGPPDVDRCDFCYIGRDSVFCSFDSRSAFLADNAAGSVERRAGCSHDSFAMRSASFGQLTHGTHTETSKKLGHQLRDVLMVLDMTKAHGSIAGTHPDRP
jgi:hypothetical protein